MGTIPLASSCRMGLFGQRRGAFRQNEKGGPVRPPFRIHEGSGDQLSNTITERASSPRFNSSKASFTCSSLMRREIISSSFSLPDM